jgi:hypothetical protein
MQVLAGNKKISSRCIAFLHVATHSSPHWERQAKFPAFGVFLHPQKYTGDKMNRTISSVFQALLIRRLRAAFLVAAVSGMLFAASGANAGGCSVFTSKPAAAPAIPFVSPHSDGEEWNEHPTIVGLWHVIYTATSDDNFPPGGPFPPTPFQFAQTFKTWHADGTEFENALLPPAGGICYGVWKELGENHVKLHHIGVMFAADGSVSSFFTIDEINTVAANGKTYSGKWEFKLWPPVYDAIGMGTPISELKGTLAATRVTVD